MLSLKMNDLAADALGMWAGQAVFSPPGGLAPGLRQRIAVGVLRQGKVLTWADSAGSADGAPSQFPDLTAWECADSSLHLEDFVPVKVPVIDYTPQISEADQRVLLLHGMALAIALSGLVRGLEQPTPVRCIIGANDTNATFRFHQIRPGEFWNAGDLDSYQRDKLIVVDIEPTTHKPG